MRTWLYIAVLQVVSEVAGVVAGRQSGEELEGVSILRQIWQGLKYCGTQRVWMSFDREEAVPQVWAANLTEVSSAKRKKGK
jgi:hypothetical protein